MSQVGGGEAVGVDIVAVVGGAVNECGGCGGLKQN